MPDVAGELLPGCYPALNLSEAGFTSGMGLILGRFLSEWFRHLSSHSDTHRILTSFLPCGGHHVGHRKEGRAMGRRNVYAPTWREAPFIL